MEDHTGHNHADALSADASGTNMDIPMHPQIRANRPGKGAELMIPMTIPVFGGMFFASITMLTVPMLYSLYEEFHLKYRKNQE